ncbi:hypothetical protein F5884DRAFT_753785 [Xylogone sp. PMI_703]|nr:hypothetical protein F5884DRAFT_753785 [Xylogone sp. PMI_703]
MSSDQKNKVDISSFSPDEQQLFRLYGRLPSKSDHSVKHQERKYFDSGDFALFEAAKASSIGIESVGSQHPILGDIPHLTSPGRSIASQGGSGNSNICPGTAGSSQSVNPAKRGSFLNMETSIDKPGDSSKLDENANDNIHTPPARDGIPIER